ncbi:MAG: TonB-dependent receptor [Cyclobacteriaceae bacterium]|nr:TonB-dependent receptor [Cyclobacteriaceae bacterium]
MKYLFLSGLLVICFTASAQTVIRGEVRDVRGMAVPGANVFIKDSYDGASTDTAGYFAFNTHETGERILSVSSIGYQTLERALQLKGGNLTVNFTLEEEVSQLDAVVISAGAFTAGEERRRTILKPLDIATTAGATADIAGALNSLPGTQKVGESGRLFVRGGDSDEARTFVDGMLVLNPYSPAAPNTPTRGRFLPFMFKGTSFSTGGYSAEYGQALSSALVLNSKDKAEYNQTDLGLLSVGGDVAHTQVWKQSSFSGKIQYTNLRPYTKLINQRIDWREPVVSTEGTAAYRQQIGKGILKAFGTWNESSFSLWQHDIANPSLRTLMDLTNQYRYGNLAYRSDLNEKWSIRSGLSYTLLRNKVLLDGKPMEEVEAGTHTKIVAEHSLSSSIEWHHGAEIIQRDYHADRYNELAGRTERAAFRERITALFSEAELLSSSRIVAKLGGRLEHNALLGRTSVDPRISLAWKPGRRGQFGLAYGVFRQSAKNQYLRVNSKLLEEQATHLIINYQRVTDRRTFRVEAYHKQYQNLIKFDALTPDMLTNSGQGYARGAELFWRDAETFRNIDYWVSYSFLDTRRDYLSFPSAAVPSFASRHNFSFVYKHFITPLQTQVGFTYSFASGRPYYNPNLATEQFQSQSTPSYHDLSVNISYLPNPSTIVYLSCTNLLGRDNVFGYEYSSTPDASGAFAARPIRQPAKHFLFIGLFYTISKNKTVNQLPNL